LPKLDIFDIDNKIKAMTVIYKVYIGKQSIFYNESLLYGLYKSVNHLKLFMWAFIIGFQQPNFFKLKGFKASIFLNWAEI